MTSDITLQLVEAAAANTRWLIDQILLDGRSPKADRPIPRPIPAPEPIGSVLAHERARADRAERRTDELLEDRGRDVEERRRLIALLTSPARVPWWRRWFRRG